MFKKWRKRLAVLLTILVAAYLLAVIVTHSIVAFSAPPHGLSASATTSPSILRVMTYNLHYEKVSDETARVIRDSNADIVCLQESNEAWESKVRATAAEQFPHMVFHHETYAGGTAVLSRNPIEELFYETPPAGWFHGCGFVVTTNVGRVKCLNIHLRPGGAGGGGLTYLNYFRLGTIHPQEIDYFYKKLQTFDVEQKLPTLILGDFNEGDDGNAMQFLKDRGFINAVEPFDGKSYTWHGRVYGIALWARPDHVLHSSHFRAVDAGILKEGESDHRAVMALLRSSEASNIPTAPSR